MMRSVTIAMAFACASAQVTKGCDSSCDIAASSCNAGCDRPTAWFNNLPYFGKNTFGRSCDTACDQAKQSCDASCDAASNVYKNRPHCTSSCDTVPTSCDATSTSAATSCDTKASSCDAQCQCPVAGNTKKTCNCVFAAVSKAACSKFSTDPCHKCCCGVKGIVAKTSCDKGCDTYASSCDTSCDKHQASCDGSCDFLNRYSCDSSCDVPAQSCDFSCDKKATSCDDACDKIKGQPNTIQSFINDDVNKGIKSNLAVLLKGINQAGLGSILKSSQAYTIFAPDNKAFERFNKLVHGKKSRSLNSLIKYHVVKGVHKASSLKSGTLLMTLDNLQVRVSKIGSTVLINQAKVTKADVRTGNSIIHIIDEVLTPMRGFTRPPKVDHKMPTKAPGKKTGSCDASCDYRASCDGSCDINGKFGCDTQCDGTAYSCDASCDTVIKPIPTGCDGSCDYPMGCDKSCDYQMGCDSSCDIPTSCDEGCDYTSKTTGKKYSCDQSCDAKAGCDSSCDQKAISCDSSCDGKSISCDLSCDSSYTPGSGFYPGIGGGVRVGGR